VGERYLRELRGKRMLNNRVESVRLLKYLIICTFILTLISLITSSKALAQWPPYSSYGFPYVNAPPPDFSGYIWTSPTTAYNPNTPPGTTQRTFVSWPEGGEWQSPYYQQTDYNPFSFNQPYNSGGYSYNPFSYQQSYYPYGYQQSYSPYSFQQSYNPYGYGYQQAYNPYSYQQPYSPAWNSQGTFLPVFSPTSTIRIPWESSFDPDNEDAGYVWFKGN